MAEGIRERREIGKQRVSFLLDVDILYTMTIKIQLSLIVLIMSKNKGIFS
jgi:hypothetical protein